jgi:hypothetical protein
MDTTTKVRGQSAIYLLSALLLLFATLFPTVTPAHVAARAPLDDLSTNSSRALPAWWHAPASSAVGATAPDALQQPRMVPVAVAQAHPLALASVDHFDVALPPSAIAGGAFPITVTARAEGGGLVGVTTTLALTTNAGEPIAPISTEMISGTALEDVTLTVAGPGKLVQAISGTVSGQATLEIIPADVYRLELSPSNAAVTAGETQAYQATAYDEYDNVIGDVTASTTFSADAGAGGSWDGNTFTSEGAGMWAVEGAYGGITGTASLTVQPADLYRFDLAGYPGDTVAGESFPDSLVVTAFDVFDNVKTDYVGTVVFSSSDISATLSGDYAFDGADAGVHAFPGGEFALFRAPTQTITVEDQTAAVSQSSGWIGVEPAELRRVRVNWIPGNGGQASGNPVEVGAHTMDIYETFSAWAGAYDEYDNYREDVEVNWGATGVLAQGALAPSAGISTTFTPAPALSGTGVITAVHLASGQLDSTGLFTIEAPRLTISKRGDPDPVAAGGYLFYTLVYANVGDAVARGVRITETYDPNVSFIGAGPPPNIPPDVWTRPTLGVGQSSEIYVAVLVDDSLVPGTAVANEVRIGGSRLEQHGVTETTVVTSTPDLILTLNSTPDPVEPGGDLVYRIDYENQGNAPVHNAHIVAIYDEHVTFLTSEPPPDGGAEDEWSIGDVQAGGSGAILVTVAVDEYLLGTHTLVTSATIESDETAPFVVYEATAVAIPPSSLQLSMSNEQASVEAGDFLVYALSYRNLGSGPAYSTTIVATPPSPELFNTTVCQSAGPCEWNGEQAVYDIGTVPSGGSGYVSLLGRVRDPLPAGMHTITASATITTITPGDPPDGKYAQDVDEIATRPDLEITADYDDISPYPGKRMIYTVRYRNTGHIATEGVVVTATQAHYTLYDADASSAWQPAGDRHFVYTVGPMGYDQSGALSFVVTVPTETFTMAMRNFDSAFGIFDNGISGEDADPGDNIALAPLGLPDLIVTGMEVNWETLKSHEPGNHVTVTVKNQGTGKACNTVPPYDCWKFYIDLYINPTEPVPLYPSLESDHIAFTQADPLGPGESKSYSIDHMTVPITSPLKLPDDKSPPLMLYARVDGSYNRAGPYGQVAEYNELNNLYLLRDEEYDHVFLPVLEKEY